MVTEFFKSYQPQVLVFGHIPLMTDDAGNEEVDGMLYYILVYIITVISIS